MHDLIHGVPIDSTSLVSRSRRAEPMGVGDSRIVDVLSSFAATLLKPATTRRFPELAPLGFFLRRTELAHLCSAARSVEADVQRVPRGLVFHVPPANVDTVFVYSWALSFLCGNTNVVRVSDRTTGGAATAILDVLRALLSDASDSVSSTQWFVSMGHDDDGFAELSAACDLRVIWGGDSAVSEVRRHQLAPRATELTFPDRSSLAVIDGGHLQRCDDVELAAVVELFANDAWWFDQAACSSPRALVWVGDAQVVETARGRFLDALEQHLCNRGIGNDPAMSVQRRVSLYGAAIELNNTDLDFSRTRVATIGSSDIVRGWFGVGGFSEVAIATLDELIPHLIGKDQTLTHFGIARADLLRLVHGLNGRAIDRMVPIGQALRFGRYWDGFDLLRSMTKSVSIVGGLADVLPDDALPSGQ